MRNIITVFKLKPAFFILLPVFFVFHGFAANYNSVPVKDASRLLLIYTVAAVTFFFIGKIFFKENTRAAIFSFAIMSFNFFFGNFKDFLKSVSGGLFFSHYSFVIPICLFGFGALIWFLKKNKKPMLKWNFYLNSLFILLIFIDACLLLQKPQHQSFINKKTLTLKCDSCTKPNIYFLVFDEYSSSAALKENWHYDNSDLDSFLSQKGFRILSNSKSNYNFTPFSIASTLNMNFLKLTNPSACTIEDYKNCFENINSNEVCTSLHSIGYDIVNYSIFDVQKNSSPVTDGFLPVKTKLITSQTFIDRVKRDLLFHILSGKCKLSGLSKYFFYSTYRNNQKIINLTLSDSANHSSPKFVYSHIEMPHHPFYFDKEGRERNTDDLISININSYLEYLPKTNEVIKQIVDTIFTHAKQPFVIVLMGDHGFRENQEKDFQFRNLNAVYLSSGNYKGFYDSITNVNEFSILFNNLFNAKLPLKKDSSVFLLDKSGN